MSRKTGRSAGLARKRSNAPACRKPAAPPGLRRVIPLKTNNNVTATMIKIVFYSHKQQILFFQSSFEFDVLFGRLYGSDRTRTVL